MNDKNIKGKTKLNIFYFIIFTLFIFILQGILYTKTIKMDSLNKELHLLKENSEQLFTDFQSNDYKIVSKEFKSKHIKDVYVFKESKDLNYPFISHRKLINNLHYNKNNLDSGNILSKLLYDSCDSPNKLTLFNGRYIVSYKTENRCYAFESINISKNLESGLLPIWYLLFGVILVIIASFIFVPKGNKSKISLSILVILCNIFFYLYSFISLQEAKSIELKQISSVSKSNINNVFILTLVLSLLFIIFYLTSLNKRFTKTIIKYKTPYLYILPGGLGILLLSFTPLFSGIVLSFFRIKYSSYKFVFFQNYTDILIGGLKDISNPEGFYYTFFITIIWTALNIFFHLLIGMAIALVLNKKRLRFKKIYSIIFIIPWAIPNYITALIWKSMFHKQFGSINSFLVFIGFERISWFSETTTAFLANLLTNIWLGFPFMMVMTLGALQSIPPHLYDAAIMDGANKWQQFKHITLPMLKPALLPSIILGIIWTFNMFNVIYLVSGGEPNSSTDILITEAYRWAFERNGRYGYSAAYATIIFIVLFLYTYVTDKLSNKNKGSYND